ncbi:gp6 protein [Mycobacteroides abscessus]|nr:gp6 protein [Mycobacteroides abscessus]CPZ73686.1 gp6 protein [Mycobacteroides abscessus]
MARTYRRGARLKGPQSPERSTLHGMNVVGLDLSLTGSGIAAIDPHTRELATAVHSSPPPADDNLTCHTRRHRTLVDGIVRQVLACDPVLVVVEGLQFSVKAKDSSLTRRGFLWWAVIEALCDAGVPVLEVSPSQIKKFATGKGNASKAEVVAAYAVAWPNAAHTRGVEDRADASFAAALGAAWLGVTGLPLRNTAARRQVLKGLSRPSSPLRQLRISNASDTAA